MLKLLSMWVTQKDLAARLGLTVAAVSMALRNHPRISERTRQRVQAEAEAAGYVVNPAYARRGAVRHGKRARPMMPLALVLQQNPRYAPGGQAYRREVRKVAARLGYDISIHLHHAGDHAGRLGNILYARGVEAVMVGPVFYERLIEEFPWKQFSLAGYEAGHLVPPCHLAMPDVATAIQEAAERAVERGYRRLAFAQISEPVPPVDLLDRYGPAAYLATGAVKGLEVESRDFDGRGRVEFERWVRKFRPDVVLGQTEQFYWWLKEAGWRIPRDMGYMNLRMDADRVAGEVSGFEEDHLRMAHLACQLVDMEVRQFFRGPPENPARMLVRMPWYEGKTLPVRERGGCGSARRS